jgi:hypothetical protein
MYLNLELLASLLEAVIRVEVRRVYCDIIVTFVLEGQGDVDDQLLSATDAEVWVNDCNSLLSFHFKISKYR